MPTPLVPKLNTNHRVPAISKGGRWETHSIAELGRLAEGLASDFDSSYLQVDSVPDVWARPLLFQMALYDDSHPLHSRVTDEWRGLVSIIALMDWRHFQLTANMVSIAPGGAKFSDVLFKLRPRQSLFEATTWSRLYTFALDNKPIGLTSPTTLVCTGSEYSSPSVPWFVGGVLRNPLSVPTAQNAFECQLNQPEREAVAGWLDRVHQNLQNQPDPHDQALLGSLFKVINSFADDLGAGRRKLTFIQDALGMTGSDAFSCLDEIPSRPDPDLSDSNVLLVGNRDDRQPTPLVVLDSGIPEAWGLTKTDVIVIPPESLATAIPYGGLDGRRDELNGRLLSGVEWRKAEDFFTNKLFVLENETAFVNTIPVSGSRAAKGSPILPLRKELLDFYRPSELAERVEFRKVGGDISVRLRLTLSGFGGSEQDFTVERVYDAGAIVRLPVLPVVDIWPNFQSPQWSSYYVLYNGPGAFYVKPTPGAVQVKGEKTSRGDETVHEISLCDSFPEAMECFNVRSSELAGLILISPPKKTRVDKSKQWTVGVDLGTTNTTVYVREDDKIRQLDFPDRLVPITRPSEGDRLGVLGHTFIPPYEQPVPLQTLYQDLSGSDGSRRTLLDGHIFFLNPHTYKSDRLLEDQIANLHGELKWSHRQTERELVKSFIEQLVTQIRAEAVDAGVGSIQWVYSIPTSFTGDQYGYIKQIWRQVAGSSAVERTESLSSAVYFLKEQNAPMIRGSICMDIGGFSTDIAIWQQNKVKVQSSLRLASRHILVNSILAESSSFNSLGLPQDAKVRDVEVFLGEQGSALLDKLAVASGESHISRVRSFVALGLSGLLYYAGLLVRQLVLEGQYEPELPHIFVGGNGSKMLHWLDNGQYSSDSPINALFQQILQEASGVSDGDFRLLVTPTAKTKHEVASGLVRPHELASEIRALVLAGESFSVAGKQFDWNETVTEEMLVSGMQMSDVTANSSALLDVFDQYTKAHPEIIQPIAVTDGHLRDAKEAVDQHLMGMSTLGKDKVDVEPLTIVMLRGLLDSLRR